MRVMFATQVSWAGLGSFLTGLATLLAVLLSRFGTRKQLAKVREIGDSTHEIVNGHSNLLAHTAVAKQQHIAALEEVLTQHGLPIPPPPNE